MTLDELTAEIIAKSIAVHSELGPGLLESVYKRCLAHALRLAHIRTWTEVRLPLEFAGLQIDRGYVIDLLVENVVIVEVKALQTILPVHKAQLLSYLRLAHKPVGLLVNFHVDRLVDRVHRVVNNYRPGPIAKL